MNYGYTLCVAHRYEEAAQQFRKTIELDPKFAAAHRKFAYVYALTGKWAEAEKEYRAYVVAVGDTNPPPASATAKGYAQLVRDNLTQRSKQGHVWGETLWAGAYAAEGDRESTIKWLQTAAATHESEFLWEIRNPLFDFVRSDPRYVEMMRGIGLPP
jgi:tetratricopeptide (TPR) repeat protein